MTEATRFTEALYLLRRAAADMDSATNMTNDHVDEGLELADLLAVFQNLKDVYKVVDEARKRVYKALDRLDKGLVPEALENAGTDKVRVPELKRSFYIVPKLSARVMDKDAAFQWLRDHDADGLITETINAGTLTAFVKELMTEQGLEPPEDIIKLNSYNTTGSSKYTPKKEAHNG